MRRLRVTRRTLLAVAAVPCLVVAGVMTFAAATLQLLAESGEFE